MCDTSIVKAELTISINLNFYFAPFFLPIYHPSSDISTCPHQVVANESNIAP